MDENVNKDQDLIEANWLTNWEDQCVREFESDTNMDERIQTETEQYAQKLWLSFQNSATAIAQLYRGKIWEQSLTNYPVISPDSVNSVVIFLTINALRVCEGKQNGRSLERGCKC